MSQRNLAAELRSARITAPPQVREHVRLIASADTTRTNRFTWKRALVVVLPAAAAIAAVIVVSRPAPEKTIVHGEIATLRSAVTTPQSADAGVAHGAAKSFAPIAPAPTPGRVQQYEASLSLRLSSVEAVSTAVQRALRIAQSLGGYPVNVDAGSRATSASADLTLKVPRAHVREAVARLSQLGTITAEHLDIQDLEAGLNTTDRTIARLQSTLVALRTGEQTPTVQKQIATLTNRIVSLQRAKASTLRTAHYATVSLHLATPAAAARRASHHGPLHWLLVALTWFGIGLVYVLVLGTPVLLLAALVWFVVRIVRRRREDALLSRS